MKLKEHLMAVVPALTNEHFSSNQSDLYVLNVPGLEEAVKHLPQHIRTNMRLTRSDVPGQDWFGKLFYEFLFMHSDYWESKLKHSHIPKTMEGKLIVFEGIDGSGKTTQITKLAKFLRDLSTAPPVLTTCEPTYARFGEEIRLRMTQGPPMSHGEEVALFIDDRKDHWGCTIAPALARNTYVLCDRYYFSNMAYQSFGQPEGTAEEIRALNEKAVEPPHLTIILDISPEKAMQRVKERNAVEACYEKLEILRHVRDVFLSLAGEPDVVIISAEHSVEETFLRVLEHVLPLLKS